MKQSPFIRHLPVILALVLLIPFGCTDQGSPTTGPPSDLLQISIHQGIAGEVRFWEGDFMPVILPAVPRGKITPVARPVLVYTPSRIDDVLQVGYGAFYLEILTRLVAETTSNDSGFFQIALPPGRYSLFVREGSLYYANSYDGQGFIQPVTVTADSVTRVSIEITYKATF